MIKKTLKRVQLMISRALLLETKDDQPFQLAKLDVLDSETPEDVERLQPYGLSTHVPAGGEAVVACVQGNRDDMLIVALDNSAYRVNNLPEGEVVVYSKHGNKIHFKTDGEIVLNDGTDNAIAYTRLKEAFDTHVADFNTHISAYNAHFHYMIPGPPPSGPTTAPNAPGVPTEADMSGSIVESVKLP